MPTDLPFYVPSGVKHVPGGVKVEVTFDELASILCEPKIEKVIFHPPATIVFWNDGTKTVVKDTDGNWKNVQKANKSKKARKIAAWQEAGILNAIAKKFYKNYQDVLETWIDEC